MPSRSPPKILTVIGLDVTYLPSSVCSEVSRENALGKVASYICSHRHRRLPPEMVKCEGTGRPVCVEKSLGQHTDMPGILTVDPGESPATSKLTCTATAW